ncbi:diguanylate cyclase [Hippea alviniae]|uniref:sensor domain-containing diguanylate cyclase n=1 Tax=Hippea alviniae TaxID=1279027 RepID=UPI0003B52246|nr:diguanylate cyclase [Hippea alviniae]
MLELLIKNKKATEYTFDYLLSYYRVLFEKNPAAIFVVDKNRNLIDVNPSVYRLLGYKREELIGKNASILHPNEKSYFRQQPLFEKILDSDIVVTFERSLKRKDGRIIWTQMTGSRIMLPTEEFGVLWSAVDSTELHRLRKKLEYSAGHDYLTGLYNRSSLECELERVAARAQRTGEKIMVCIIDLDDFKQINDEYGHHAGDVVLKTVARRLRTNLRSSDFISRFGGDEFVLIFEGVKSKRSVDVILSKIDRSFKQPMRISPSASNIEIEYSMGVYIYVPSSSITTNVALRFADSALYKCKELKGKRKINWVFSDKSFRFT